jgi:hypothetical protein
MKPPFWAALLLLSASGISRAAVSAYYVAPGPSGAYGLPHIETQSEPIAVFTTWHRGSSDHFYSEVGSASSVVGISADFDLDIEGPNGTELQPGVYAATRAPFQAAGAVGFDVDVNGIGGNTSFSFIDVLEIAYDSAGNLTQLAVDFTEYRDTPNTPGQDLSQYHWISGSLRFNSDIPLSVPEPAVPLVASLGLALAACKVRRR